MHIPRCGGTSLENAIAQTDLKMAARMSWSNFPHDKNFKWERYDFIAGHYPAQFEDEMEDCYKVALVRHPLARVLSHYNYVHEHGYNRSELYTIFCQNATLEEWLTSPLSRRSASNLMTRFFAGDRKVADIDLALENLDKFDAVFAIDQDNGLQQMMDWICDTKGVPRREVGDRVDNQSSQVFNADNIDYVETVRIESNNDLDIQVYNKVLDRMQEWLQPEQ